MIKEAERKLQDFSIHKKTVNSLLEKNQLREAADYVSHILNDYSLENVNDIRDGLINVKNNLTSMTRAEMLNYSSSSEIMGANNRIITSIKYLLEQLVAHFDKPITD